MTSGDPILRLASRFSGDDPEALAAALRTRATFQGDTSWLTRLLDASDQLKLPEVPPTVSAALHDLMPAPVDLRVEAAATIHDSRRDSVLVGARRDVDLDDAWTIAFSAESADVLLDGEALEPGQTDVSGHVLMRVDEPRAFTISVDGPVSFSTRTNSVGVFHLGQLPEGAFEMSARCADFVLRWSIEVRS